jgi:hypothetical protein
LEETLLWCLGAVDKIKIPYSILESNSISSAILHILSRYTD